MLIISVFSTMIMISYLIMMMPIIIIINISIALFSLVCSVMFVVIVIF